MLLALLAVLAVFWTLHAAQAFLLPLLIAVPLKFVLVPLVRTVDRRLRVPPSIGAAAIVVLVTGGIAFGVTPLVSSARTWIRDIPAMVIEVRQRLDSYQLDGPVEEISAAAEEVEEITKPRDEAPVVKIDEPSLADSVLSSVQAAFATAVLAIVLAYFLLVTDGSLTRKLVAMAPTMRQKRHVVSAARSMERQITRYISAVTMINVALGVVVATLMWLTGMPNPVLWGVMAAALNFVPYLGALVGVSMVALVALANFPTFGEALVPPAAYALVNSIEGLVVTPAILGRWHQLSPVAILVWLTLWSWMWGIPGALLAVPLLMFTKIACDHVRVLRPVGALLGAARTRRSGGTRFANRRSR